MPLRRIAGRIKRQFNPPAPRPAPLDVRKDPDVDPIDLVDSLRGMLPRDQVECLYELARQVEAGVIVEVGSYRGKSTCALGLGSGAGHQVAVFAVDPHEEFVGVLGGKFGPADRKAFYHAMIRTGCWEMVRLINLSSEVITPNWDKPVGLLWIDGDHSYEGVQRDFLCWEPHVLPDGRVAFDDVADAEGGPRRLVTELCTAGWVMENDLGRMAVLRRA